MPADRHGSLSEGLLSEGHLRAFSPPTIERKERRKGMSGFGIHGNYLRVDLTRGTGERQALPETLSRRYLGGSGLGTALLIREDAATQDPLAAQSSLVFAFSPFVGSPLTTSAKFAVVGKSPLTGRLNDSLVSSGFALSGKRLGTDAVVVTGQAAQWSILVLDDDRVVLEPADSLLGLSCPETEQRLREQFGSDFRFAVIGPAGERQALYATISHDGRHAGRGGSGAVLGSKRLKGLAVRGTRHCRWADPAGLAELAKDLSERSFGPATAKYRELGTAANLLLFNRLRTLPTRNFQSSSFEGAAALTPEALAEPQEKARASCAACTIGCEHLYPLRWKGQASGATVRVEYENLFALGPLCGVSDPQAVLAASQRCDELGLDTISTGGTIAFAMECAERGWLDAPWLRFGNGESLLQAIDLIGTREGLGDLLAQGTRRMAQTLGPHALAIAPQVKGLEIPGYEPRALQAMALGFATATRGADHNRSGAYEADFSDRVNRRQLDERSVAQAIETEDRAALLDSLILCKFLRGVFSDFHAEVAEMMRRVTGWDMTPEELRTTARRIVDARKWFNIQAGWRPEEDTLPERFLTERPDDDPASMLSRATLVAGIRGYNLARGWTEQGWLPTSTSNALQGDCRLPVPSASSPGASEGASHG